MSRKVIKVPDNRFLHCYAAAIFARQTKIWPFIEKLNLDNVVVMNDIVKHTKQEFFRKYDPAPEEARILLRGMRQMSLQFAD
jgi:hypothetical protein